MIIKIALVSSAESGVIISLPLLSVPLLHGLAVPAKFPSIGPKYIFKRVPVV